MLGITEEETKAQAEKNCIMTDKNERACYVAGYLGGYEAAETERQEYEKKLLQSNLDQQDKIVLLSQKVYDLQKAYDDLQNKNKDLNKKLFQAETDYDKLHWDRNEIRANLEAQIEKLIDFVLSKTECCDVCPITDTCLNGDGTCHYTGILAKGEEEVTREWLMQKIAKEIKEK